MAPLGPSKSSAHLMWALSPLYTCCLVSFVPALHAAMKLRRRDLWFWAGGLIAGDIVAWLLMVSSPGTPESGTTQAENVGAVLALILAAVGTAVALGNREAVFARQDAVAAVLPDIAPVVVDPAIARSLADRARRAEALALSKQDPVLARDLMIGRPDLIRQYDDGGLIDVNHVPEAILVSHLGFTPDQARALIEVRERIGSFLTADDLCVLANLPQHDLDMTRDRIVTL
jgi:hypothetical protein